MSTFKISVRKARAAVETILTAGLIPYLIGSPAIGKSAVIHDVAKSFNLKMIDVRASSLLPEDVNGMGAVVNGEAKFLPFTDKFPLEGMDLPIKAKAVWNDAGKQIKEAECFDGWLLFLDELPNASREVQASLYQLLLDRMVGDHKLHPHVLIVAAGNRVSDRAAANAVGTALQSRVVSLDLEPQLDEWLDDVAVPRDYDSRLISFLLSNPSQFNTFNPTVREELTFSAPRTLSMLNDLLQGGGLDITSEIAIPVIAGCVGSDTAVKFHVHCNMSLKLPSIKDILANPHTCEMPDTPSMIYGVVVSMFSYVNQDTPEDDLVNLITYALRVPSPSYLVVLSRNLYKKRPDIELVPNFRLMQDAMLKALSP